MCMQKDVSLAPAEATQNDANPYLDNWFWKGKSLVGNVYNHPRFCDGVEITTSSIRIYSSTFVITRNTIYNLGQPRSV